MREIEVKFRVASTQEAEQALEALGIQLGEALEQDDQAFAPVGWDYASARFGKTFARLRTENGRHSFTVKRPENNESCLEYETDITDRPAMHQAILALGYYPTTRIVKRRRVGELGSFHICLDEVEGLGSFLEVEAMAEDDEQGASEVYRTLVQFAEGLGLEVEQTHHGYDRLIHNATIRK